MSLLDYILDGFVKLLITHQNHMIWMNFGVRSQIQFMKLLKQQLENAFNKLEVRIERCISKDGGYVVAETFKLYRVQTL